LHIETRNSDTDRSTSYVFSGKSVPPGGYTTSDPTDPTMTYGRQKVEAERRVLAAGPPGKTAVLRIPLLYSLDSDSPKHWLSELLGQLEQGEMVLVDDCEYYCTQYVSFRS
jgi:dTDP-4-dehydrorhamnose reductase